MLRIEFCLLFYLFALSSAGISPVHDLKTKLMANAPPERFLLNSPHRALQHLDNSILKATKNLTQNPKMDETLFQISKDLVSSILSKLEVQDKITRITREALDASGKNKGITAIETRRILDYISRTLSSHMLSITRASTERELHRLVFGLAQIAAEVSIVSALKDITYSSALSKKQAGDLNLRKKREIRSQNSKNHETSHANHATSVTPSIYDAIMNKTGTSPNPIAEAVTNNPNNVQNNLSPYSVFSRSDKLPVHIITSKSLSSNPTKVFLNQTALDSDNRDNSQLNETDAILLPKTFNATNYVVSDTQTLDLQESNAPIITDDWYDTKESNRLNSPLSPDVVAEIEIDQTEVYEENNDKRAKQKMERLEAKAKKAILYAGDVAYLTATSVVAMRRALTASIEVQMSVKFAKEGMSNHQELMMNLARTAAQQAGKEAKSATSKSIACERVIKLALKYTAQSHGAKLNHVANRIIMDIMSLGTLAKSMAFVSSDIAINSLYQATDVKVPV